MYRKGCFSVLVFLVLTSSADSLPCAAVRPALGDCCGNPVALARCNGLGNGCESFLLDCGNGCEVPSARQASCFSAGVASVGACAAGDYASRKESARSPKKTCQAEFTEWLKQKLGAPSNDAETALAVGK